MLLLLWTAHVFSTQYIFVLHQFSKSSDKLSKWTVPMSVTYTDTFCLQSPLLPTHLCSSIPFHVPWFISHYLLSFCLFSFLNISKYFGVGFTTVYTFCQGDNSFPYLTEHICMFSTFYLKFRWTFFISQMSTVRNFCNDFETILCSSQYNTNNNNLF